MDGNSKILTLVICTYDRNDIIDYCLDSLSKQSADSGLYNVLVVNNYDNVNVQRELDLIISKYNNVNLYLEKHAGLSVARNSGAKMSQTEWVGYIDDDCLAPGDFVKRALDIISTGKYVCFGGHISSWWLYDRPKWLSKNFGSKPKLSDIPMVLEEDFNWGGNIFIKKEILDHVDGFDEDIGMIKNRIGYSAENRVQMKLRAKKYLIGYDPNLVVKHLVAKHKFNLLWHLQAAFAEGRDGRVVFPDQYTSRAILRDGARLPINLLRSSLNLLTEQDFYYQNWVVSVFKPLCRLFGKLYSLTPKKGSVSAE